MDFDVRRHAPGAARRLMQHHPRVRQRVAFALGAGGEQEGAHAGGLANAPGGDVAVDELHGVVDRKPRRDGAAWRVDVEVNVGVGVFGRQVEKLRDHQAGDVVFHRPHHEDDAVAEQARVDVEGAFAASALLHHHRH